MLHVINQSSATAIYLSVKLYPGRSELLQEDLGKEFGAMAFFYARGATH
jgi:hypothetical protein